MRWIAITDSAAARSDLTNIEVTNTSATFDFKVHVRDCVAVTLRSSA